MAISKSKFILLATFLILIPNIIALEVSCEEELSIHLSRQFGMAIGDKISGKFKIILESSSELKNISLYFNETLVAFDEGNILAFSFNTKDYDIGNYNITAIAITTKSEIFQKSIFKDFMNPLIANMIGISVLIVAVSLTALKYIKKNKAPNEAKDKDLNLISISKKF